MDELACAAPSRRGSAALVALVLSLVGAAQAAAQVEDGFVSLFDGQTLAGWSGRADLWRVEDGAITGQTSAEVPLEHNEFLIWNGEVADFILRLEFRIDPASGNSGIQFRSRRFPEAGEFVIGGYQADIDGSNRYMGILYEERGRGILAERGEQVRLFTGEDGKWQKEVVASAGVAEEVASGLQPGAWARYEIIAEGNRIVQKINGRTTVDVTDEDAPRAVQQGLLALQAHVGPPMKVQFRNIRLKRLPASVNSAKAESPKSQPQGRAQVKSLPGFRVERMYEVPQDPQGSWVSLTYDDRGRLIASDQGGALYRVTLPSPTASPTDVQVERLAVEMGHAQGLCYAFDSLYVMVNGGTDKYKSGLYRLRDTNGDDQFDEVKLLQAMPGGGEHGPHAIVLAPDGKSLYICAGNHTDLPPIARSRAPQVWSEDLLLPRMWDAGGHAHGRMAPGGWIAKTDPEGRELELISIGYRNEYDIAFNQVGDLFAYDADMEWDVGAPWYRPTRVCHATSGSEFGWRSGTGKWPAYYLDSLGSVADVGPGSPTGVTFGTGAAFPGKYQHAMYLCDWSYGIIYALHLTAEGASYRGELEHFVSAAPLPATDIVVNPHDGAMYFAVGGRNTQSALYRVTYDAALAEAAGVNLNGDFCSRTALNVTPEARVRRELEQWHAPGNEAHLETMLAALGHGDRAVRFAARVAVEHQPVDLWADRVLAADQPEQLLTGAAALARCGAREQLAPLVDALGSLNWEALDAQGRLDLLRVYGLAFARWGAPEEPHRQRVLTQIDRYFPSGDVYENYELCQLLVYLQAPGVAERTLALLEKAPTQQEQIHYAFCLRALRDDWTLEQRRRYLDWFHRAASMRGGNSFAGFLRNCRQEAIDGMSEPERVALAEEIAREPQAKSPLAELEARPFVREWTMDELLPELEAAAADLGSRDLERGKQMFATAQCYRCHRVRGDGDRVGPDLTSVGGRFSPHDLLSAVIEPSKVISDQYRQTNFIVNGRVITGRIINLGGDGMQVLTDMFNPSSLTGIRTSDIESQADSDVSAMPNGLLNTLNKDEILDLLAYLMLGGVEPPASP